MRPALASLVAAIATGTMLQGCERMERPIDPVPSTLPAYVVQVDLGDDIRALAALANDDASDEEEERAEAASRRLRALGPLARPSLIAALALEAAAIRTAVVDLLETLSDEEDTASRDALAGVARGDPDPAVRAAAVAALGGHRDEASAAAIIAALGDENPEVRVAAAGACPGACTTEISLAALARMALEEPEIGRMLAARAALSKLLNAEGPTAEAAKRAVRQATGTALRPAGPLDRRNILAALLLADTGDARGEAVLRAAAADGSVGILRVRAVHALGGIGTAESVSTLVRVVGEPGVGVYAIDSLARLEARGVTGATEALDAGRVARPGGRLPPP